MVAKRKLAPSPDDGKQKKPFDILVGARYCNQVEVRGALEQDPTCINKQDEAGLTALHWASGNRDLVITEMLLNFPKGKVDPWIKDIRGRTAIDHAIESGRREIIDLLKQLMYGEILSRD